MARDGEQLALPNAELRTPLLGHGLIAVAQLHNEVVTVGQLGRGDHLIHRGIGAPIADVVGNRIGKDKRLLQDHADLERSERWVTVRIS